MTARDYPHGRWGTSPDPKPTDAERLEAQAAALDALPKPAPSQAVGATLDVTPIVDTRTRAQISTAKLWDLDKQDSGPDDYATLREIQGRADKPETIVQAEDEQRAFDERVQRERRAGEEHYSRQRDMADSNRRLRAQLADATVRAYEPPDTLTGVAFAAVEGLLAVGKRWWRR